MLTGQELGAAIDAARIIKNLSKKALAEHFHIAPPSVQGWIKTGRIDKSKLIEVIDFFSDVVGPSHWGLSERSANNLFLNESDDAAAELSAAAGAQASPGTKAKEGPADYKLSLATGTGKTDAAAKVLAMIKQHGGKALSAAAQERMAKAVAESLAETPSNVITGDFSRPAKLTDGDILIPQYDVRASMGGGQLPAEYREFVRNLVVDKVGIDDLGLKYTDARNLCIITGWGESMKGAIDDRSPVLIDQGIREFLGEGVYVFTWLGHLFIKTVQLNDAVSYKIVSKNKDFEPQTARIEDVHFHARVLGAWNFSKM